jgi:putative glutamine amidotransferase
MLHAPPQVPIVAVAADAREIGHHRWHAVVETYLRAVTRGIGAIPLIVPALGDAIAIDALLDRVDGVLLPGSRSNVDPRQYGEERSKKAEPHDFRRDSTTLPLIRAAIDRAVPLFAICRGMQELNVALGGTLVPEVGEIEGRQDHSSPDAEEPDVRYGIRQDVHLTPGGTLAAILETGTIRVNSLHHQGIGRLAPGLAVEATAPDGTIEAVRVIDAAGFAIGVQWHPEYWVESDQPSARLFSAFGKEIRDRMAALASQRAAAE